MTATFGDRLATGFAAGRRLCVGIDPHAAVLADWGLPDDADGAERLGLTVVAAAAGEAAGVKPQVACFERFGSAGYRALERVMAEARRAGLLVVADAKRGDIGSSFAAYAEAWLAPGAPLEADALTVSAYQGLGTLRAAEPFLREHGKGLFVLAATSNPEAREVQRARRGDGRSVAGAVVEDVHRWNGREFPGAPLGSIGVVLGATLGLSDFGIPIDAEHSLPRTPVLAPGFGVQGARLEDVRSIFGALSPGVLVNESRSLLAGGAAGLPERVRERSGVAARAFARCGGPS